MAKKPFITKNQINKIIKNFNPELNIYSIEKLNKGISNVMYRIILSDKSDIMLRICNNDTWWQIIKEYFIYELIQEKTDVLTPIFIYHDFSKKIIPNNFAIYKTIKGKSILDSKIKNWEKLIKNLAINLAKIHNINFIGCGSIYKDFDTGRIWTDNKTWPDFFDEIFQFMLNDHLKNSKFKQYYEKINSYYLKNKKCIDIKFKPSLIHSDYALQNIIINSNEEIKGIIDFEANFSGHSEYDLSWSLIELFHDSLGNDLNNSNYLKEIFIKEYTKIHKINKKGFEERKKIYDLCHLMRTAFSDFPEQSKKLTKEQKVNYYKKISKKIEEIIN
jgi:aminoglycoside phosphotransferase (APT) family kinase protein